MRRAIGLIAVSFALSFSAEAQESKPEILDFLVERDSEPQEFVPPPEVELATPQKQLIPFEGDAQGLVGNWTITSEASRPHCSFNGTAEILMDPVTGGHTCELIMRDYCTDIHDGIIRQSCKITGSGSSVTVESVLLEALHGPLAGYSPDNFDLQKQDDGTLRGNLRSYGRDPVIWRRAIDAIS